MIVQKFQDWLWWRIERRRRDRLTAAAFKEGRFVLRLHLRHQTSLEAFTPGEDEAQVFFKHYVLPVIFQTPRTLSSSSWSGLPGITPVISRLKLFRTCDVTLVEILAPDNAYRDRLEDVLNEMIAANKKKLVEEKEKEKVKEP